ncbi:nuclear transport factor 2 family protein [Micromonospora arborensis]|uniref:nuclear transport factor 2 family protein n=1 Tax=Micromonospora arborensis TaxID=2116518 RepID=UPI0034287461
MKSAETPVRDEVTAFLRDYARAVQAGDNAAVAASYADTYIEGDPGGTAAITNDADHRAALDKRHTAMTEQFGLTGAHVTVLDVLDVAPGYVLVPTRWTLDFAPPHGTAGSAQFAQTYVVRVGDGRPQILLYLSHEREDDAMRELGLID